MGGRISASGRPNSERLVAFEVQSSKQTLKILRLVRHEVPFYRTTRHHIPEEQNLHSHNHDNCTYLPDYTVLS